MKNDPFFEHSNYSFILKNLTLEPDEIPQWGEVGHGKSVCARNVKRDAVCAVKCGAHISDGIEFYNWDLNI